MLSRLRLPKLPRIPRLPQVLPLLKDKRSRPFLAVGAVIIVGAVIFASAGGGPGSRPSGGGGQGPPPINVTWGDQLALGAAGYEPSIAIDSTGAMYITAHKNLDDKTSWPYLASWFLVSRDDGASWASPNQPPIIGNYWKTFLGDEGDIGIDADDNVYFLDTYIIDNHIHVFHNQGIWDHSVRVQKSTGLDDRPWIAGQGSGTLHYLGNNGAEVNGGRYWYYRSANQGLTWTRGDPVPGNGWAHLDAERGGQHVYIVSESEIDGAADILVYVSENAGRTWDWSNPVVVGHRDGPGREYPVVSVGDGGLVYVLWNDATDGVENGTRIFVGVSDDFGKTWNTSEVTPFKGFIDYPTISAGPDGTLAVAFYGTRDLPVSSNSTWYLYGAMQRNASFGAIDLDFSMATDDPLYQGEDLHALHDFFEIAIGPDLVLNVAFQHYVGPCNGCSELYFIRGTLPPASTAK